MTHAVPAMVPVKSRKRDLSIFMRVPPPLTTRGFGGDHAGAPSGPHKRP
jgi:hypothetical protein